MILGLSIVFLAAQAAPGAPLPDEIVVTARPGGCRIDLADKALTDQEFDRHAEAWKAGKPVRVVARSSASMSCLSKITFRLADKGVKNVEFVSPSGTSGGAFPPPSPQLRQVPAPASEPFMDIRDKSPALAKMIAGMILAGKCNEARRTALDNGDLDAAAKATTICSVPVR